MQHPCRHWQKNVMCTHLLNLLIRISNMCQNISPLSFYDTQLQHLKVIQLHLRYETDYDSHLY